MNPTGASSVDALVKPSRIVYVITDLDTGGVPLHVSRLAAAVRRHGFLPSVVSLAPPGAVAERLAGDGIAVHSCDARGRWDVGVIPRLAGWLRRLRPDLVHSFLFHANVACRLALPLAGRSRRRLICEIQTVEIERRWHLVLGGLTHRLGGIVVGNSPSVVAHLARRGHMSPGRLRCVPGGVDVASVVSAAAVDRASLGIAAAEQVVLWVGRLDPVKGLETLIDAFAVIARRTDARLLLVGDGAHADVVRRRIRDGALEDRVLLLGRRADVAGLLKIADVFALPSYTEGMPNALLEAMAAGRAVVATDVAGCRDVVTHERTGLLVPAGDAAALGGAIGRLLRDRALAGRLGRAAADHVAGRFTLERCVVRYVTLYRDVLNQCMS